MSDAAFDTCQRYMCDSSLFKAESEFRVLLAYAVRQRLKLARRLARAEPHDARTPFVRKGADLIEVEIERLVIRRDIQSGRDAGNEIGFHPAEKRKRDVQFFRCFESRFQAGALQTSCNCGASLACFRIEFDPRKEPELRSFRQGTGLFGVLLQWS